MIALEDVRKAALEGGPEFISLLMDTIGVAIGDQGWSHGERAKAIAILDRVREVFNDTFNWSRELRDLPVQRAVKYGLDADNDLLEYGVDH